MTETGAVPHPAEAAAHPDHARASLMPQPAQDWQGRRAGLVSRFLAAALDGLVVVALLTAGYLTAVGARFLLSPGSFSFPSPGPWFAVMSFLGLLVVYGTVLWATTGRTYGNHVMGLRVVGAGGQRVRWSVAFLRALAYAVFPLGIAWIALSRENRSVQDVVLRTAVVYDWLPYLPPG
jgi:uncharacterized RDD family membrane protein YckC